MKLLELLAADPGLSRYPREVPARDLALIHVVLAGLDCMYDEAIKAGDLQPPEGQGPAHYWGWCLDRCVRLTERPPVVVALAREMILAEAGTDTPATEALRCEVTLEWLHLALPAPSLQVVN